MKSSCFDRYICGRQPDKDQEECTCTGTVYFGKRFVSGTSTENTFAELLKSPYVTKQVAGSIPCTSDAFGSDPDYGHYKMCVCLV
jgi:hypothetical protein